MIYTTEIRQEDMKGISCEGCSYLLYDIRSNGIEMTCRIYPGMDNMIRCIAYQSFDIEWVNYIYTEDHMKHSPILAGE